MIYRDPTNTRKTPIYNIIDSRAPDEAQQNKLSQEAEQRYQTHLQSGEKLPNYAGMTRQDPLSNAAPADIEFAQSIQSARAGHTHGHMTPASIWTQTVRRGGDRNSDVIAIIKRHVNPNSDVSITIHGQKGGIRRHAGFPHTKYEFTYNDVSYTWTKTHSAPGTSKLDGGSFVCKTTTGKQTLAYTTSQDDRCDGNVIFEEAAVEMGLIDVLTVTGYVLRDLDDMRENPSYLRRNDMYGYGPYGSPYGRGMGFYPTPMLMPFFF